MFYNFYKPGDDMAESKHAAHPQNKSSNAFIITYSCVSLCVLY